MSIFKDALLGVSEYFTANKLLAVCFGILLYEFLVHGRLSKFLRYGLGALLAVMVPITSAILLKVQPPIYEAGFIWTLVPVTALCAYAGVRFLWDMLPAMEKSGKGKYIAGVGAALGILFLLGNLGQVQRVTLEEAEERHGYGLVAENLAEESVLWGPRALMQWVRSRDGSVKLVYGLDMWDGKAAAYDGDSYSSELITVYEWMQQVEAFAYQLKITTDVVLPVPEEITDCLQEVLTIAETQGVNTIVLPSSVYQRLAELIFVEYDVQNVAEYTLLRGKN